MCSCTIYQLGEALEAMRKATLLAALMLVIPATSQAKTLEELLVEKGVITKGEAGGVSDAGASKVYWNRGTRIEFPDNGFTTSITTQIQTRYAFVDNDEDAGLRNTSGFSVNRARLVIAGTALNREFSYKLQTDFVGTPNDTESADSPAVRDAYIQWQPCEDGTGIRMGQFKTAISRQFNTDQAALQFADRSQVSEFFTIGRANGAMAFGTLADGMITGSAAIFNGQSTGEGLNAGPVDTKHTGVLAVRVNPMGKMNVYEESDVDYTEDAALSFGAAYSYTQSEVPFEQGVTSTVDSQIVNLDANFKAAGFSANAEFFYQNLDTDSKPTGFYAQGGYFVVPKKVELAARYGFLDCDDGSAPGQCAGVDKSNEVSATINYYFWKHSLKAQLGYDLVNQDLVGSNDSNDRNTNRWIFQVSGYF